MEMRVDCYSIMVMLLRSRLCDMFVVTGLFISGGNKLEVRGLNLDSVQKGQARFIVYVNNENRTGV